MGIEGLLQLLKPITLKQHLSSFCGQKVGVDVSPWLYKGCYNNAMQLSQQIINQIDLDNHQLTASAYILQMIELLQYYNITPIFVFDGRSLSMKQQTIRKRQSSKQNYLDKANLVNCIDENKINLIRKYLANTIRITDAIISEIISILKHKKIQYIVAPYESDSQLAKLKKLGMVDAIITEDSDLLVYGANTIFKLNQDGQCDYIDFNLHLNCNYSTFLNSFLKMNWEQRASCCIMAGCDYVSSIKGIGIKKSINHIAQCGTFQNFMNFAKTDKTLCSKIPEEYQTKVNNAKTIFKYALTYNPLLGRLEPLTQFQFSQTEKLKQIQNITGSFYPQYISLQVYSGEYDPKNLKKRNIPQIQIQSNQTVDTLKLKDLQGMYRQKKKDREEMMIQKQERIEQNMVNALLNIEFEKKLDNKIIIGVSEKIYEILKTILKAEYDFF